MFYSGAYFLSTHYYWSWLLGNLNNWWIGQSDDNWWIQQCNNWWQYDNRIFYWAYYWASHSHSHSYSYSYPTPGITPRNQRRKKERKIYFNESPKCLIGCTPLYSPLTSTVGPPFLSNNTNFFGNTINIEIVSPMVANTTITSIRIGGSTVWFYNVAVSVCFDSHFTVTSMYISWFVFCIELGWLYILL